MNVKSKKQTSTTFNSILSFCKSNSTISSLPFSHAINNGDLNNKIRYYKYI